MVAAVTHLVTTQERHCLHTDFSVYREAESDTDNDQSPWPSGVTGSMSERRRPQLLEAHTCSQSFHLQSLKIPQPRAVCMSSVRGAHVHSSAGRHPAPGSHVNHWKVLGWG